MQYKKLGEICDKGSSNIVLNKIENNDGQYPLFGASGFVKNIDFYHNEKPYIGIVKDGSGVGRVDLYPAFSSLVGTMQYIFPKEDIHISYLKYLLQSLNLAKFVTGAAIPHIYFKDYSQIPVPVPPLATQSRIVSELDLLTSLIDNQEKQLDELSKLQQSTFFDMFGDPVENEKNWPVKKLGEVCEFKNGINFNKVDNGGNQYTFLGVSDFKDNVCLESGQLGKINIEEKISDDYFLENNDIVFVRSNGSKDLVGRAVLIKVANEKVTYSGFCIRCRIVFDINSLFLIWLLKFPTIKDCLTNAGRGCNISNVNQKVLNNLLIPLPPLSLQTAFAEKISAIEEMKKKLKASIAETQKMFDARMQDIFG